MDSKRILLDKYLERYTVKWQDSDVINEPMKIVE